MGKNRFVPGALAALLGVALLSAPIAASAASPAGKPSLNGRVILAGNEAPLAARRTRVGTVAPKSVVNFDLVLKLRDPAGAAAAATAVSTPGSASFRRYLTDAEWEARFSPTTAAVGAARAWLESAGFEVGATSADRITIAASGTAAEIESAFKTDLGRYRVAGKVVRLAGSPLSVPSSLAATVAGAMGVNEELATPATTPARIPPPGAFVTAPPCGTYYGEKTKTLSPAYPGYPATVPDTVCGYKPGQFRSAYGLGNSSSDDGAGVTVAVIDAYASPTLRQDTAHYFHKNDRGNPISHSDFHELLLKPFDSGGECGASGWSVEQAIDVESVHSMAPGARLLYVGASDCANGLFDAEQNVIDHHRADVVTNSWGDDGGDLLDSATTRAAYDDLFKMADATGMSVLFSSGDDGDEFSTIGFAAADYPPSSPWVTGVGGTTLQIGSSGQRLGELGWSTEKSLLCTETIIGHDGCTKKSLDTWLAPFGDGGSGGGTSYVYSQPSYQAGVVPAEFSEMNSAVVNGPMRVVPDISMDADPATGLLIGLTERFPGGSVHYGETRYGGTSLASPLLAGAIADADEAAGEPVGFINPVIYGLSSSDPSALYDVVPGGHQGQFREDYVSGGRNESFRVITYEGVETFCDPDGNCESRPNTLVTAPGFDNMTGLGSVGPDWASGVAGG